MEKVQQIEVKLIFTGTNEIGVEQITIQKHKDIIARIMTDSKGVGYISPDLFNNLSDSNTPLIFQAAILPKSSSSLTSFYF